MTTFEGFSDGAKRVLSVAADEATELGQAAVGTEHLLIGLLSGADDAARALLAAGATLAAARHKVREAVGGGGKPGVVVVDPAVQTARAARAIGRAVRFSHQDRADHVGSVHLLLGVLDVEGTAGQVLRGLGVDVPRLQESLRVESAPPPMPEGAGSGVRCASCGSALAECLTFEVIRARGAAGGTRDAVVYGCGSCGAALGAESG